MRHNGRDTEGKDATISDHSNPNVSDKEEWERLVGQVMRQSGAAAVLYSRETLCRFTLIGRLLRSPLFLGQTEMTDHVSKQGSFQAQPAHYTALHGHHPVNSNATGMA